MRRLSTGKAAVADGRLYAVVNDWAANAFSSFRTIVDPGVQR
jgi:hypothetical protein